MHTDGLARSIEAKCPCPLPSTSVEIDPLGCESEPCSHPDRGVVGGQLSDARYRPDEPRHEVEEIFEGARLAEIGQVVDEPAATLLEERLRDAALVRVSPSVGKPRECGTRDGVLIARLITKRRKLSAS
jgi:hypothetical protein